MTADPDLIPPVANLEPHELSARANAHLSQDRFGRAYPYVTALAAHPESDAATCLTAGLLALILDKGGEAIVHFRRATSIDPGDYDAAYNLALAEMSQGNLSEAQYILASLLLLYPDRAPLYNDLAVVVMGAKDTALAMRLLEKALRIDPNFSKARAYVLQLSLDHCLIAEGRRILELTASLDGLSEQSRDDIKRCRRALTLGESGPRNSETDSDPAEPSGATSGYPLCGKRIVFIGTNLGFVASLIERLSRHNEARTCSGQSDREMSDLLRWADLAWFEWCDDSIIRATRLPKQCPIVCRLHSYEAFTDMPGRVDWAKVDKLIFVNESVRHLFRRRVHADVSTVVIHNGVDINRFVIPEGKRYGKKIASVGYINYKKNPTLLLYCFKKIHEYDPSYTLHVAGAHQDPRLQLYFEHFLRRHPLPVHFHGWITDMPAWYADKDFIISTSLFESFHYSVAEGMACGLLPLIHDWCGADDLYPPQFLFSDPSDCLALLTRLERADKYETAHRNRCHIMDCYNQQSQVHRIERELAMICDCRDSGIRRRERRVT